MKLYLIIISILFVSCKKEVEQTAEPKSTFNTFTVVTNKTPFFIYQNDTTYSTSFNLPINDTALIVVQNDLSLIDSTHIKVYKNNSLYSEHHSFGVSEVGGIIY